MPHSAHTQQRGLISAFPFTHVGTGQGDASHGRTMNLGAPGFYASSALWTSVPPSVQ